MPEITVIKGKAERLTLKPWTKNGNHYVSLSREFALDGEWVFKKGGMALQPSEARDLAEALVAMADTVEALEPVKEEGAE